jgi:hypothetical protein
MPSTTRCRHRARGHARPATTPTRCRHDGLARPTPTMTPSCLPRLATTMAFAGCRGVPSRIALPRAHPTPTTALGGCRGSAPTTTPSPLRLHLHMTPTTATNDLGRLLPPTTTRGCNCTNLAPTTALGGCGLLASFAASCGHFCCLRFSRNCYRAETQHRVARLGVRQ